VGWSLRAASRIVVAMEKEGPPANFGTYAGQGFAAETRDGLPWWQTCITSALMDLSRVDGFVPVLVAIARALRHGADPERVVGSDLAPAAFLVALEWLAAEVEPDDVTAWIQAGCWEPRVARRLADAGVQPRHLLDADGRPRHWMEAPDGECIPVARAAVEWEMPTSEAVDRLTASADAPAAVPTPLPSWVCT
jgi:hypothetical protein